MKLFQIFFILFWVATLEGASLTNNKKLGYGFGGLLDSKLVSAKLEVYSPFDKAPPNNTYFPVRLYIDNVFNEDISGIIISKGNGSWNQSSLKKEFKDLPLNKIESGHLELLLPYHQTARSYNNITVKLAGQNARIGQITIPSVVHPIAVSSSLATLKDRLNTEMLALPRAKKYNQQLASFKLEAFTDQVDQLLGWEVLVMTLEEYTEVIESENRELTRSFEYFLKRGGSLWVTGQPDKPLNFPNEWNAFSNLDHKKTSKARYQVGLGSIYVQEELNMNWSSMSAINNILFNLDINQIAAEIPEIDTNILGFMVMVLIFALLVGPFNLFLLCKGDRIKLMVTTPIISLCAVVVFIAMIVFLEGFGGQGATVGVTYIDSKTHEHFSLVKQGSRTGVITNARFHLDDQTFIWPTSLDSKSFKNHRESPEYLLSDDQAISGWFTSRNIQVQEIAQRKLLRERVELKEMNSKQMILSTMKERLDYVWTYNKKGELIGARHVRPGQEMELELLDEKEASFLSDKKIKEKIIQIQKNGRQMLLAMTSEPKSKMTTCESIDWTWHKHFYIMPVLEKN